MRNIIVEGMDGSGKDTLISDLMTSGWPSGVFHLHERASTSLGGPVDNLAEWVRRDSSSMVHRVPHIYNRHPLISEPIYAPIRGKDKPLAVGFDNEAWMDAYRRIVASYSVVVICQPPYETVKNTLNKQGENAHMPGVWNHSRCLYDSYKTLTWPGRTVRYDYTTDTVEDLTTALVNLIED